jgi:thiamine pyrophosphokinase
LKTEVFQTSTLPRPESPEARRAFLFCSPSIQNPESVIGRIGPQDIVVGVDGGGDFLYAQLIRPALLIGDMDSITPEAFAHLKSQAQVQRYPAEKDATDTELALQWCAANGYQDIVIVNNMEGRFDHTLGVISNLLLALHLGLKAEISNGNQTIFIAPRKLTYSGRPGDLLSLMPVSDSVSGISTQGLQYPLNHATLQRDSTRGLSNVIQAESLTITHETGILLVILNRAQ